MSGVRIFAAEIRGSGSAVSVSGKSAWQVAGFPSSEIFNVEKISTKKGFTEVELRARFVWLKLRFFDADLNGAFAAVTNSNPVDYLAESYSLLSREFFSGPLSTLSSDQQLGLIRYAHVDAEGAAIRSEVYKDNLYMVVDLGSDSSVYNDLKFTQASLIAHVLNEDLLKKLKGFASILKGAQGVFGVKLEYGISHKSFLDEAAKASEYKLQLYAPVSEITKFADADVTNQQFVDSCVVIVDGSRIQVPLSGGF
jgi:hypothetical protein